MIAIRDEIAINRTPGDVFEYVADIPNFTAWQEATEEAVLTSEGPLGVGSTFQVKTKILPIWSATISGRVTEYETPNKMVIETGERSPFSATGSYSFEPIEGGTRVTFDGTVRMRGLLKLIEPLVGTSFRKQSAAELRKLKEVLEGQQ